MTEADLNATQNAVTEAIKRCQPKPFVQPIRRPLREGLHLLAMNVWPSLSGAVVGVRVDAIKDVEGYGDAAWVFPVRVVTGTDFLQPEQLPMFMSPEVRRAVILLGRIPKGTDLRIAVGIAGAIENVTAWTGKMGEVEENDNAVTFTDCQAALQSPLQRLVIPLDQVRTVVREERGWLVCVRRYN
jgi:hypothetical protein